jgi:excisionase family DNA binding protein
LCLGTEPPRSVKYVQHYKPRHPAGLFFERIFQTKMPTPNNENGVLAEYLTEQELAEQLHITVVTLKRWRALRQAPPVTRLGRTILFRRDAVDKWLVSREVEAE